MRKKILVLLCLLALTGCGEKKEQRKNNPYDLSYYMVSYETVMVDESNTRVYAVIENTSQNSGTIAYINYNVENYETGSINHNILEYNESFNAGEQKVIIFDMPVNINEISSIYVTPLYDNKENIPFVKSEKEYKQVKMTISERKLKEIDDKSKVTIKARFLKSQKLKKLKITVFDSEFNTACIGYANINKTVETNKDYKLEFECNKKANLNGNVIFEK